MTAGGDDAQQLEPRVPDGLAGHLGISSPKRIVVFFLCVAITLAVALWPAITGELLPRDFAGIGLVIALLTPALAVLCVSLWYG